MPGTPSPKEKKRNEKVFIRMSVDELAVARGNAEKYCGGNLSKWLRERAQNPMLDVSIKMQDERDEA